MSVASNSSAPAPPVATRRRWLWIGLITSLVVNALLVGMVSRALWHTRSQMMLLGGAGDASLPAFVDSLPTERRDTLRRAGPPDRPGMMRPLRMEVRRARADAARLFLAEPFDKQAFIAAQARLFDAESRLRQAVQKLLPEIGERMTVAERRAYLNWRARGFNGGFRRGENGGRGDDPGAGPGLRRP